MGRLRALALAFLAAALDLGEIRFGDGKTVTGVYAGFSPALKGHEEIEGKGFYPAGDPEACSAAAFAKRPRKQPWVAVVRRGTCLFTDKAYYAKEAGASLLVIVSTANDTDAVPIPGPVNATCAPALSVSYSSGEAILEALPSNHKVAVTLYSESLIGVTEFVVLFVAVFLVAVSAAYGSADVLTTHGELSQPPEDLVVLETSFAGAFCVAASSMLVFLFFFIQYAVYLVYAVFAFASMKAMIDVFSPLLIYAKEDLGYQVGRNRFSNLGIEVNKAQVIMGVPAVTCVVLFLTLNRMHYGWLFQDILAGSLLPVIQRTLRVPNLKVIAIFLVVAFFFDIFWVFVSGNFFGKSVMVEVATGGSSGVPLPLVLLFPTGTPWSPWRALGLGDLALPGILISYVMRVDWKMGRRRYWPAVLVGYALGLCSAFLALAIMKMGQPALLYIVPGILIPTFYIAFKNGEIGDLWEGLPEDDVSMPMSSTAGAEVNTLISLAEAI